MIYYEYLAYDTLNTLDEIKNYLRIDFNEDDEYLQNLLDSTLIYIDACCGKAYRMSEQGVKLAKLLQCKLVADLYENRSTSVSTDIVRDTITTTILQELAYYNDYTTEGEF